jgi:SAM-dependent methyltransferase
MRQALLGRPTVRFMPLPVERVRTPQYQHFRTPASLREVPFVPTPQHVVDAMLRAVSVNEKDVLYDLGCGDGRIVISAARDHGARAIGVDIDPERIRSCNENGIAAGVMDRVEFRQQSFFDVELREATVVTLYLLPWTNAMLAPKLLSELRPGARIVAHGFSIKPWTPDRTIQLANERTIFCWTVPANIKGRWACAMRLPNGRLRHVTLVFEQEWQEVDGSLHMDGAELPLEQIALSARNLRFTFEGAQYFCQIEEDRMHGHALGSRCLELRARRTAL